MQTNKRCPVVRIMSVDPTMGNQWNYSVVAVYDTGSTEIETFGNGTPDAIEQVRIDHNVKKKYVFCDIGYLHRTALETCKKYGWTPSKGNTDGNPIVGKKLLEPEYHGKSLLWRPVLTRDPEPEPKMWGR